MLETTVNGVKLTADPTGHYEAEGDKRGIGKLDMQNRVLNACGFLPGFMIEGGKPSIAENMAINYQFFMGWRKDGAAKVEDGVFKYTGDPDQYPYMKAQRVDGDQEIVYLYPHAIVCVCNAAGQLIHQTRMD